MAPRADTRFELRLPVEQLHRVDAVRGEVSRSEFTRQALEAALTEPARPGVAPRRSAPPRASVMRADDQPLGGSTVEEADVALPEPGCPECGGALSGVLDRPGINACVDCGWTG